MNSCALDFPDGTFDVVIDKGTMDSILCGEGSTANVAKMCSEMSRCVFGALPDTPVFGDVAVIPAPRPPRSVLKTEGVFFIVSYGTPENRLSYLENDDYKWAVTVHTIGACPALHRVLHAPHLMARYNGAWLSLARMCFGSVLR